MTSNNNNNNNINSNNNRSKHNFASSAPSTSQPSSDIFVFANDLLSLEKELKTATDRIQKLKHLFNNMVGGAFNQQHSRPSRVNRHGSHRLQPYPSSHPNSLRQPIPPSESLHYTRTLRSP